MTEDSFASQGHAYRILRDDDEENLLDLEPVEDARHLDDPIFLHDKLMPGLEDDDDDSDQDLTPFLFSSQPPQLNGLNFLNVVTCILHLGVSWGIGVWGLDGLLSTRVEIILDHETMITPAKWAYYVWIPILATETIFSVAQLLPEFRARPIVQSGTGFFFFYTCLLQMAWTIFFSFELFLFSFISVSLATLTLASLLASQSLTTPPPTTTTRRCKQEYWLFRFPFFLHFGWIVVMALVHLALLVRTMSSSIPAQLATDLVALGLMLPVACSCLLQTDSHNFIIPGVAVWAYVSTGTPCNLFKDAYWELTVFL